MCLHRRKDLCLLSKAHTDTYNISWYITELQSGFGQSLGKMTPKAKAHNTACVLNLILNRNCRPLSLCAAVMWFLGVKQSGSKNQKEITSRCGAVISLCVSKTNFVGVPLAYIPSLPSRVWLLVHWRSGRSFTPRPEGAHILSPLWPHKESQVLRRAWLAALICYLWLISEALSHRWWSRAVNLTRPTFDGACVCVCLWAFVCVCVLSPRMQ